MVTFEVAAPPMSALIQCRCSLIVMLLSPASPTPSRVRRWSAIGSVRIRLPSPVGVTIASYVNPPLPLLGYCETGGEFDQLAATLQFAVPVFGPIQLEVMSAAKAMVGAAANAAVKI